MTKKHRSEFKMSNIPETAALNRLFKVAQGDTHQSKRVADFLLAWWNAESNGGFDLTSLWNLDQAICEDLTLVFGLIGRTRSYPDAWGHNEAIRGLVEQWRSPVVAESYEVSRAIS